MAVGELIEAAAAAASRGDVAQVRAATAKLGEDVECALIGCGVVLEVLLTAADASAWEPYCAAAVPGLDVDQWRNQVAAVVAGADTLTARDVLWCTVVLAAAGHTRNVAAPPFDVLRSPDGDPYVLFPPPAGAAT